MVGFADGQGPLHQGASRSGPRLLGLAAARRRLGLEQRRARLRRRRVTARRHPLRPASDRRDARRHAPIRAGGDAHRRAREHARQRRPLLRQPAGRRRAHHRLARERRGDGRAAAGSDGPRDRERQGAGPGRRVPRAGLRAVRVPRHPSHAADRDLRRRAAAARRRARRSSSSRSGPRTPAATCSSGCRPSACSTPATSSSSRARRSCGRGRSRTGSRPASGSRSSIRR